MYNTVAMYSSCVCVPDRERKNASLFSKRIVMNLSSPNYLYTLFGLYNCISGTQPKGLTTSSWLDCLFLLAWRLISFYTNVIWRWSQKWTGSIHTNTHTYTITGLDGSVSCGPSLPSKMAGIFCLFLLSFCKD